MDTEAIFSRFVRLAGLEADGAEGWKPLCAAAAARLAERLLPGADAADERLLLAARPGRPATSTRSPGRTRRASGWGMFPSPRRRTAPRGRGLLRDELLAGAAVSWTADARPSGR